MTMKKTYILKDETVGESEFESTDGIMISDDDSYLLIDFSQTGQFVLECVCDDNKVSKKRVRDLSRQWANDIAMIIMDNIYDCTLSNAQDDEEIEVVR